MNEIQLRVRRRDKGARRLLFLHGLQSQRSLFDPFFSDERFAKYALTSIDFAGFGQSDKPRAFSYDLADQADLVARFIDEKVTVVGHSLGGMIGTLLLEKIPDRIHSLVSLEGNLTEADCGESAKASALAPEKFRAYYEALKAKTPSLKDTPDYVFLKSAKSIVQWSKSNRLLRIFETTPHEKLLLVGQNSLFQSRPSGGHITTKKISGAGHFLLTENPDETMKAISEFLGLTGGS